MGGKEKVRREKEQGREREGGSEEEEENEEGSACESPLPRCMTRLWRVRNQLTHLELESLREETCS